MAYLFGETPSQKRVDDVYAMLHSQGIQMFIFDENDFAFQYVPRDPGGGDCKIVKEFFSDKLIHDPSSNLLWTDLFRCFQDWASREWPEVKPLRNQSQFLKTELAKHGLSFIDTRIDGKKFRGYRGWTMH